MGPVNAFESDYTAGKGVAVDMAELHALQACTLFRHAELRSMSLDHGCTNPSLSGRTC